MIGLIGAGRLGICLALLLEEAGYELLVSDVRTSYVHNLNQKFIASPEPEVADRLKASKNITATDNNFEVIEKCDTIFTVVATPSHEDGSYNVDAVWDVVEDFRHCEFDVSGKTLIVCCTTNPGDCDEFAAELNPLGVDVFYNPEFIAQGSIIRDLQRADMVLIGGPETPIRDELTKIYNDIQVTEPKINFMTAKAAEIVKIATNCFLTTKISFANMLGQVMTKAGLNEEISTVLGAIGDDSRIGRKFLNFGYGYGGPCLPRDNRAYAAYATELGLEYNLGDTTDNFNKEHSKFLRDFFIKQNKKNLPFSFDYITYKKGTDIMTESSQFKLATDLLDAGCTVYIDDREDVIKGVEDYLVAMYDDRVRFGPVTEEVFAVEL